jgi:hypothetical protein
VGVFRPSVERFRDPRVKTQVRISDTPEGYNILIPVSDPTPKDDHDHNRHGVYASETTGLLLIALVLLILTLIRSWHDIHWGWR